MSNLIVLLLLLLFLAHLVGFTLLGLKRREFYYLALVVTFALLSASFAIQLFWPDAQIREIQLHRLLRYCAWFAAAISISWTATRIVRKRRRTRKI